MIKIDIFSGFLGAGKTTLIKKLIQEAYKGEKVVLIENEFGEIGVDGGFLQDAGIQITEMNSGCICCSLVGDFSKALKEVAQKFSPERIIIEPSGVGKLSDVIKAVQRADVPDSKLNAFCTVVDAKKCKTYLKNFGEFFLDQVENASCIVLSHTAGAGAKVEEAVALLKEHTAVTVVTTEWEALSGSELLSAIEAKDTLRKELEKLAHEEHHHHHHDDDECDDPDCECHHHHHHHHDDDECDDPDCKCHHHHHHHHDDDGHEHEHHHHHHHDDDDGHEHEHHHHHHHADEVFSSWGTETVKRFTKAEIENALKALSSGKYGQILRAKGIVAGENEWLYFDYVPEEIDIRCGQPTVTGRLCVIGCELDEEKIKALFLG